MTVSFGHGHLSELAPTSDEGRWRRKRAKEGGSERRKEDEGRKEVLSEAKPMSEAHVLHNLLRKTSDDEGGGVLSSFRRKPSSEGAVQYNILRSVCEANLRSNAKHCSYNTTSDEVGTTEEGKCERSEHPSPSGMCAFCSTFSKSGSTRPLRGRHLRSK